MSASSLDLFEFAPVHDAGGKTRIALPTGWTSFAEFSACQQYRYKVEYRWDTVNQRCALFLMMNPSTATTECTDPTVAKCARLARRWSCGALMVGNACAYRATNRMRLLSAVDPVGPRNHEAILEMAQGATLIVIAHGRLPGDLQRHADSMCALLRKNRYPLHVLRLLHDGTPGHPLYIPEDTQPLLWIPCAVRICSAVLE